MEPEHGHGRRGCAKAPGAAARLHCKAVCKGRVGNDSGPDPAVPGGRVAAGTPGLMAAAQQACGCTAVTAGLTLRMHTPRSANTALCRPGPAPPRPRSTCLGTRSLRRAEGWPRDRAVGSAGQGAEEAAGGHAAPLLPQAGHGHRYG